MMGSSGAFCIYSDRYALFYIKKDKEKDKK
jgi:hypothetical protein